MTDFDTRRADQPGTTPGVNPTTDKHVEPGGTNRRRGNTTYELRNLGYSDEAGRPVLRNLWLAAEEGTITCVIGSTPRDQPALLSLMSGLTQPTEGSVVVDGIPLDELSEQAQRSRIGLVVHRPWISRASVADNIGFGHPDISLEQIVRSAELAEIDGFVEFLPNGYDTHVTVDDEPGAINIDETGEKPAPAPSSKSNRPPEPPMILDLTEQTEDGPTGIVIDLRASFARRVTRTAPASEPTPIDRSANPPSPPPAVRLTLGQRRRLALARALVQNPRVVILEEPTADLDPDEERLFMRLLDRIAEDRVVIIATHRLSLARRADRVLVIDDGRLVDYTGSTTDDGTSDHSRLWDLKPLAVDAPLPALRPVTGPERDTTASRPWGIEVGTTMVPGHVATRLLARTENSDIWVAWSEQRQEPVRIKIPRSVPVTYRCYEELSREHRALSACRHPGLAAAIEADFEAEMPYVVHEFIDSRSMETTLERHPSGLDPLDVLYIGFELAGALHYLHQRGHAHLGLRPRHIRTRGETIVIADFTTVGTIGETLTPTSGSGNGHRGEHLWFAPEQVPGRPVKAAMDVYTLGVLLHVLTAGRLSATVEGGHPILTPYRSLVDEAPTALVDTVDGMLAPDPVDRPDMEEVVRRFRRAIPSTLVRPRISEMTPPRPPLLAIGANN